MQPSLTEKPTTVKPIPHSRNPVKRILSLDVVRGITIAFMIMVNNNGGPGSWRFMNHANWNGLTPTDLVFPTFVFVVGVSVVFAFDARLAKGATPRAARKAHHHPRRRSHSVRHHRQQLPVLRDSAHALLRRSAADRRLLPRRRPLLSMGPARLHQSGSPSLRCSSATGFSSAGFPFPASAFPAATFLSWT